MSRRVALLLFVTIVGTACSDHTLPTASAPPTTASVTAGLSARTARERLARTLALALADPDTRAAVKQRLDASNAPEGKLQFQALVHNGSSWLIGSLVRAGATTPEQLLADLDAARGLELYLPVASQRQAWTGDARYLVGTIGNDGEIPVGFGPDGVQMALDPATPPDVPVLALVPQETDFTRGHPADMMACTDMCNENPPGGTGNSWTGDTKTSVVPGVYLVESHFTESHEGWLKGKPEYEYHVYGIGDNGETELLSCTGEHAGGPYAWDQNDPEWSGLALLLSDSVYNQYQAKHPGAPVRIMAWEDDDEACVDHADVTGVSALITAIDNAYNSFTSGKSDPWYERGLRGATSTFSLYNAVRNIILTNDDFIGNAVDGSITGDAPNGANWVLKTNGTLTSGWFTTIRL
ncbi:MAG TPA: hypothetical protein VGL65_00175 [Gemmatimonadales bacterium]|jgi:hypothetical protein